MPYRVSEAQRHKFPKAQYRVRNWGTYDQALQKRGSLTLWVTPEAIAAWHPTPSGKRGRARSYSDLTIETGHLLRLVFGRPWRQTEGLLRSITTLLGVNLPIPDHTTFSRRSITSVAPHNTEAEQQTDARGPRFDGTEGLWRWRVANGKTWRAWSPDVA